MPPWVRGILEGLGLYGLWGLLAALAALAAYQVHVTLIFFGILIVKNPATRPVGWSTATISGLSRFLVLVLGGLWLLLVGFLRNYLHEGRRLRRLRSRVLRLLLFIGAIYGMSYGVLFLF